MDSHEIWNEKVNSPLSEIVVPVPTNLKEADKVAEKFQNNSARDQFQEESKKIGEEIQALGKGLDSVIFQVLQREQEGAEDDFDPNSEASTEELHDSIYKSILHARLCRTKINNSVETCRTESLPSLYLAIQASGSSTEMISREYALIGLNRLENSVNYYLDKITKETDRSHADGEYFPPFEIILNAIASEISIVKLMLLSKMEGD